MLSLFDKSVAKGVIPALTIGLLLVGCKGQENKYQAPPPPTVTVSEPAQRTVKVWAEYTGNTVALESVDIRARVEGYLEKIAFEPSAKVSRGQLLFKIDPKPFQAKVNQAKADLATAKAELSLAEATLTRKARAFKAKAVSEVEVIQAKAEKAKAEASIQAAEAAVEAAQIDLGYTSINSPIDGRISRSLVDVGNLVGAGETTKLSNIVKIDPIYAYFNVSEQDILYYQRMARENKNRQQTAEERGTIFLATAESDEFSYRGSIDYIDNQVDAATGTIQVRAVFPNSEGRLVPGYFVRLRLAIETRGNAVLVPDVALGTDQRGKYLYVVDDKNQVEYRSVEVGALEPDGLRLIDKGLKPKEKVVVNGLLRVRPGIKVNPQTEAQEKKKSQAKAKSKPASSTK
ncbi:efflux RND transporter periplasmic adaptor subunit [Dethiosulfatarculus sandiegensis]|uniref:Secretion protein HylD n=1 Tax=Dethiosulfatarculus sandiegensis TaxID=1429043 RepID=A0A0D2JAU1_9BACT|nr:efflux RND transporter periplasmic adaptor subunit [Dethiosulfatarculus sandiegensis]KIX15254.1 secretion protein HylD [Dethiosulfatarculus sandiegensis]